MLSINDIVMPSFNPVQPPFPLSHWTAIYDAAFPSTPLTVLSRLMHAPWLPRTFPGFDDLQGQGFPLDAFAQHFDFPVHPCFKDFTLVPLDRTHQWWLRIDAPTQSLNPVFLTLTVLVPVLRPHAQPPAEPPFELLRLLKHYYAAVRAQLVRDKFPV